MPSRDFPQPSGKSNCSRLALQMELFVDDLVECHGDVRVRAMMVPCGWKGFGSDGCSGIYCDTLSVSQYDSKVRSGFLVNSSTRPRSSAELASGRAVWLGAKPWVEVPPIGKAAAMVRLQAGKALYKETSGTPESLDNLFISA